MYKVYSPDGSSVCVTFLIEVRELTGATADQIKRLAYYTKVLHVNGFHVINYSK